MKMVQDFLLIRRMKTVIVCAAALVFATGCSTIKRSPLPSEVFNIPGQYQAKMTDQLNATGFQQGWLAGNAVFAKYDKVMLDPQLSSTMIENTTWDNFTTWRLVSSQEEDNNYILGYTQTSFNNAFASSTSFKATTKPGPGILRISFFITQVVPGDGVIGGFGNISSLTPIGLIILPLKIMIRGESAKHGGAVASETIISDSVTGEVLAVFLDREKGITCLFNTEDFTAFGADRATINAWTTDLASTLDQIKAGSTDLTASKIIPTWKWFN